MDIKKFKKEIAKMPELGFKGNMFVGKKKPALKTPSIRELAEEWGIPVKECGLPDIKNFPDVVGLPVFNNENEER